MKNLKIFARITLALLCFSVFGCGGNNGTNSSSTAPDSSATEPAKKDLKAREFVEHLNELKQFRLPAPSPEKSVNLQLGETVSMKSRQKSSNDFWDIFWGDLFSETGFGQVVLYFYGEPGYSDYLGCRMLDTDSFFRGTEHEQVEARQYYIHAVTFSELSGYCFEADASVLLLPGESNRVLFTFHPTGSFWVQCFISNPPGVYCQNCTGKYYSSTLMSDGTLSLWQNPTYSSKKLAFTLCYYDEYANPASFHDVGLKLSVQAEDGQHIMSSTFNPADIVSRQRPLELSAAEFPTGTVQYSGEPGYQKENISVELNDGDTIIFPLVVKGTATSGIKKILASINNKTTFESSEKIVDVIAGAYSVTFDDLPNSGLGDNLTVSVWDYDNLYNPDIAKEVDGVTVEVKLGMSFSKDVDFPEGTIENPTGSVGHSFSIGTFVADATEDFHGAVFSCYTADYPLGRIGKNLILRHNGAQIGITLASLSQNFESTLYSFDAGFLSIRKGDIFQLSIESTETLATPVMFQMEFALTGTTAEGKVVKSPFAIGQKVCVVPPIAVYRDFSIPNANEDCPTPVGEPAGKNALVNLGAYNVIVYVKNFTAMDFLVSAIPSVALGQFVDDLMLVRRDTEVQVGDTIMYPPGDDKTPVVHFFHDELNLSPKTYRFQLYGTKKAGTESSVEFKFQFSIAGNMDDGVHFQTPFIEGQNVYIASLPPTDISVSFIGQPPACVVYENRPVNSGYYTIEAPGYTLSKVRLELPEVPKTPEAQQIVRKVDLYGSSDLNPSGTWLTENCNFTLQESTVTIPVEYEICQSMKLTVQYDLGQVGTGHAPSGINLKTKLQSIVLKDPDGKEYTIAVNLTGNDLRVCKAYPIFKSLPLAEQHITNLTSQPVCRVQADAVGGSVSIKQLPKIELHWKNQGPSNNELKLYNAQVYAGPDLAHLVNVTYLTEVTNQNGISVKEGAEASLTETDDGIFVSFLDEDIVKFSRVYEIRLTPANFDKGIETHDQIIFSMVGDSIFALGYISQVDGVLALADTSSESGMKCSGAWSDMSAMPHSQYTDDWHNLYLIQNLPLGSVVLDK